MFDQLSHVPSVIVSKQILVQDHSHENAFHLNIHFLANETLCNKKKLCKRTRVTRQLANDGKVGNYLKPPVV